MFLTEYNQEKVGAYLRLEAEELAREQVATDMLKDGKPLDEIIKYSRLAKDAVVKIANSLGVTAI